MTVQDIIDSYIKEGREIDADFIIEIYRHSKETMTKEELKETKKDLRELVKIYKQSIENNEKLFPVSQKTKKKLINNNI